MTVRGAGSVSLVVDSRQLIDLTGRPFYIRMHSRSRIVLGSAEGKFTGVNDMCQIIAMALGIGFLYFMLWCIEENKNLN
jgi:hypothetical protein